MGDFLLGDAAESGRNTVLCIQGNPVAGRWDGRLAGRRAGSTASSTAAALTAAGIEMLAGSAGVADGRRVRRGGVQGGHLQVGYDADLLVIDNDPLADVGALPAVRAVMLRGKIVVAA